MEYIETLNRVCSYFDVTIDDLRRRDTTNKTSLARNFVYYILHTDLRLSINKIGKILNRKSRNIQYRVADIKYNIEHSKEYARIYKDLIPYIYDI